MNVIKIHRGYFSSGSEFKDIICPLLEAPSKNNHYITGVKGFDWTCVASTTNTSLPRKAKRARLYFKSKADFELCEMESIATIVPDATNSVDNPVDNRSDEEVSQDIKDRFDTLSLLAKAASNLKIRALLVSGTAGTGKTFEIEQAMRRRFIDDKHFLYHQIKGSISPVALYCELFRHRDGVLILDDSDNAFNDYEAIQILKAATESSKKRLVSWRKYSKVLEDEGIPNEFEFEGCVVILTNSDLEVGSKNRAPHYEAIVSRAHYVNTVLHTEREKLVRIRQVIQNSGILNQYVKKEFHQDLEKFLVTNAVKFRELSIRTVVKLAELCHAFPENWKTVAKSTLMKNR